MGLNFQPIGERVPRSLRFWNTDLSGHQDKILLILSLVVSALVGLVVVGFVVLTERLGSALINAGPWKRLLFPLGGSLLGGWLLYYVFPDARGSGIPQTRAALILRNGFISLRTALGKFICSSISLGSGVALGREGPSVQIGGGIASVAGRRLGLGPAEIRSLVPVGTAAAVAAAFNTPLAAVLFTLEEILADLHARVVGSVVIGAATSWIVLRLILGDEPLFHVPAYQLVHPVEFLIYALLGLAGGIVSTVFVKALLWQRQFFRQIPSRWQAFVPGIGGLIVGLLAILEPGVLGVGYNLVSEALNSQLALSAMLLLLSLKVIATSSCYGTGNAGGIFGPSLFIGAMLGGSIGQFAHAQLPALTGSAGAYALVGMGAAFAGIVQTPMTSVIMIFEITRDYTIIVPLMIANLCSYFLAQRLQRIPVYEALSQQDGVQMPSSHHRPEPLTVQEAMVPAEDGDVTLTALPAVHPDETLDAALQKMAATGHPHLRVHHREGGGLAGVLRKADVFGAYEQHSTATSEVRKSDPRWLRVLAVSTVMGIFIISGLVFWQRTRTSGLQEEALRTGQELLRQGRAEEAVMDLRRALAMAPDKAATRTSLGLALADAGLTGEARPYLDEAVNRDPNDGPVLAALAEVHRKEGDRTGALQRYTRALAARWPVEEAGRKTRAQFEQAQLLVEAGRRPEAVSRLLQLAAEPALDLALARSSAEAIRVWGSTEQAESAYRTLLDRFPADTSAWVTLGDIQFARNQETAALASYQQALKTEPDNQKARAMEQAVTTVLAIDPNARGLSFSERAKRWDEILGRVVDKAGSCEVNIAEAKALLGQRTSTLRTLDAKIAVIRKTWDAAAADCRQDAALEHLLSR